MAAAAAPGRRRASSSQNVKTENFKGRNEDRPPHCLTSLKRPGEKVRAAASRHCLRTVHRLRRLGADERVVVKRSVRGV